MKILLAISFITLFSISVLSQQNSPKVIMGISVGYDPIYGFFNTENSYYLSRNRLYMSTNAHAGVRFESAQGAFNLQINYQLYSNV